MNTNSKVMQLVLTAVVALLIATPTALGQATQQDSQFTIDKVSLLSGPIIPDIEPKQTTIDWTYTVTGQGGQVGFLQTSATTLVWEKPQCTDSQVFVTGPLAQTVQIQAQDSPPTQSGKATFTVSATTEAPGEVQLTCTFKGKVDAVGQAVKESNPAQQDLTFTVGYFGLIQAVSTGRLKEAGPQKTISYQMDVTNFGNARTNVAFSLGGPEAKGDWKTILPERLILESKVSGIGGDVAPATFQVSTPFKNGWNNDEETFKIVLTPTSAKTGNEGGNPVEVNVLARVRGVYVPSLEPLFMLGAILGTALVARMRRE